MSDHKELIERYIQYPQPDNSHDKYHVHHNFLIQAIFKNDEEQANYWLNIFKEDSVRIRPHEKLAESYYHLYNGLFKKDNDQFLEGLNVLNSPKQRKKRIRDFIQEECYSTKITGYLKLAKYRGLEIENTYEDVPNELLVMNPLPEYKIPYWFLEQNLHVKNYLVYFNSYFIN